jgi:chemotaxis response regulator CheB
MNNRRKPMSELTELIKEAAKRKKRKQLSALKKHYRIIKNWVKKHPGKATGLGALGVGAGYGGYEAIKHLLNREKKSSLFDENVVNEIADEIIKEARNIFPKGSKITSKKQLRTIEKALNTWARSLGIKTHKIKSLIAKSPKRLVKALKKRKKNELGALSEAYKWIKKNPGKATGLGALGAGAGYGGYEAIKHLMNREKKSSLLDEIIAEELADEIIKQAAEDEIYDELLSDSDEDVLDEDEDEIIDYLADLDDEDEDEDEDYFE